MILSFLHKKISIRQKWIKLVTTIVGIFLFLTVVGYSIYLYMQNATLRAGAAKNTATIQEISKELSDIKSQDQYKTNIALQKQIDQVKTTFAQSVTVYEELLDLENPPKDIKGLDSLYANVLSQLAKGDYTSAASSLADISSKIIAEQSKLAAAAAATIPTSVETCCLE